MNRIELDGYKSFKHLDLALERINILIGSNGSGKSNFLSFFEFLNALYEQRMAEYVALGGGTEKFLFDGSKVTDEISAKIELGNNRYGFTLKSGDDGFIFTHEKIGYTSAHKMIDDDKDITTFGREAKIRTYDGLNRGEYINKYLRGIKKYHFHDTGRNSPFTRSSNILNDKYELYSKGENLAAFLYNIQKEYPKTYRRILMVIRSVAPYFNDFYFNASENGDIRLQWKDRFSEMTYGPTDLSDGTIRFIALTTLFLQPNPPAVIIIDEPELGLHPFAVSKLSGLIQSASQREVQIIAATQSAELISYFKPKNIVTVNQVNGESEMRRLNSEELAAWLEEYTLGDLWKQNIIMGGQPR